MATSVVATHAIILQSFTGGEQESSFRCARHKAHGAWRYAPELTLNELRRPLLHGVAHDVDCGNAVAPNDGVMIWFFEHNGQFRRCELHPDRTRYRLVVQQSDGVANMETYDNYEDVLRRTKQLESEWMREGWCGPFSRDIR